MAEESSKTIEIAEFVPIAKVDPIYFEGAYYLGPDKGGEKAYKLLTEAMRQTGRCALAKWAARGKGYLVLLRPIDNGLVMQVLHYADEVRSFDEVPVGDAVVRDAELKLAVQLIEQIAPTSSTPRTTRTRCATRYHEAIQRKVEGQEVTAAAPEQPRGQIIDLMEALKASLAAKAAEAGQAAAGPPAKAAAPGAPRSRRKCRRRRSRRRAARRSAQGRRRRRRSPRLLARTPSRASRATSSACERCPRLRAWCREVAAVKVRRFQDQEYWGRPAARAGATRARGC